MRELSLSEVVLVSGGKNAEACKADITNGAAIGAIAGGAAFAWAGAWSVVAAGFGALGGMTYAAKNSPNCKDGSDYNR